MEAFLPDLYSALGIHTAHRRQLHHTGAGRGVRQQTLGIESLTDRLGMGLGFTLSLMTLVRSASCSATGRYSAFRSWARASSRPSSWRWRRADSCCWTALALINKLGEEKA